MRSGKTLFRAAFAVFFGLAMLFAGGCATDRQVISQAEQAHTSLQPAVINDPQVAQYIQTVGDRIIAAAQQATQQGYRPIRGGSNTDDRSWMFSSQMKFHVVAADQLNAFTTGGEHMYVYSKLLASCRSEDELAAVMSHEFAHVYGRHVQKGMNRQYAMLGAAAAAGAAGYALGGSEHGLTYAGTAAGGTLAASQFVGMGYTREDERDADSMGFDFYTRAGWDPHHFADFFRYMIQQGHDKTPEMISDHPSLASRVEAIDKKVAQLPPNASQYRKPPVADPAQFAALKQKVVDIAARMPSKDPTKGAGLLLASYSSCFAGVDTPEQKAAQHRLQAVSAKSK